MTTPTTIEGLLPDNIADQCFNAREDAEHIIRILHVLPVFETLARLLDWVSDIDAVQVRIVEGKPTLRARIGGTWHKREELKELRIPVESFEAGIPLMFAQVHNRQVFDDETLRKTYANVQRALERLTGYLDLTAENLRPVTITV